ncbi:hypothetical protein quinque_008599 [Culex quinquefasciatus]
MSEHEDLEDGEIEDGEIEDDDEEGVPVAAAAVEGSAAPAPEQTAGPAATSGADTAAGPADDRRRDAERDRTREIQEKVQSVKKMIDAKARLIDEVAPSKSSKRAKPVVDDWATKVENALANALIKDGVEPPMPSISRRSEERDAEVPSKRRKRDRQKKKPAPAEKATKDQEMEEIDLEYEMMNVRGGSPRPQARSNNTGSGGRQHDRSDSEDSYSSDESRGGRRDRRDRDRERDREYNRRKRKNRQRNRANRDNRKRKRDDSDDDKHHSRNSGPRKMELCKFYLMDCCAKREKCLYMHSDFPCKYYYLGLKCKEQDKCLFSHGDPLTDELRVILLKHLETAPQEILGDFPRINRESAIKMVNATHQKLTNKNKASGGGAGGGDTAAVCGDGDGDKIPSLLDMMAHGDRGGSKNRRSRWCDKNPGNGSSKANESNSGEDFLSLKYLNGVISQEQIVNLEEMGIHNLDQISQLTVAQLNELGLSINQIHELQLNALNMKKLRENIAKQGASDGVEGGIDPASSSKDMDMRITPSHTDLQKPISSDIGTLSGGQDVDMRFLPMVNTAGPADAPGNDNSNSQEELNQLLPLTGLIKTPTVDYSQYLKDSNLNDDDDMDHTENADKLMIAHDDEDEDDDDEENNLKINIEEEQPEDRNGLGAFEWDREDEDDRRPLQPQPAVFDTKSVTQSLSTQKIDYTKSFGMYKPADEEPEKPPTESCILDRYSDDSDSSKKKSDIFSTRKSMYNLDPPGASSPSSTKQGDSPNSTPTLGWTPTAGTTTTTTPSTTAKSSSKAPLRPSIYDDPCATSDNSDNDEDKSTYADRDKDMRLNFLGLGDTKLDGDGDGGLGASSSDVDLRLPFKPIMTNYIPATEIDGSVTSHAPIVYKVHEVDIPKPNYKDIRRNTPRPSGQTKDPRLRRIFGMYNEDDNGENKAGELLLQGMRSPRSSSSTNSVTVGAVGLPVPAATVPAGPIAPRVDPRTKRSQENKSQQQQQQDGGVGGSGSTSIVKSNQLDVQTILLRSPWYTDLSSKHKIMVNQQLAILSTEMKKYHNSDKSTDKLAEFMQQLATNQMLQFILTNLNVYVDDSVTFCEVPMVSSPPLPLMNVPPPNLMPPINMLPPVNIPPPVTTKPPSIFDLPRFNCPPEVRPGLLGVAPNMPFEQFLAMGQVNKSNNQPPPPLLDDWGECWDDDPSLNRGGGGGGGGGGNGGGGGFVPNFERNTNNNNNFNNGPRGNPMRNNNRNNFRNNDRWNNSGGNGPNRRNNNHNRRMDKKK